MTTPAFEAFLARVYTDAEFLARFLADRRATAQAAGLSAAETSALEAIDAGALRLTHASLATKRAHSTRARPPRA
jgi:hypothetical protein